MEKIFVQVIFSETVKVGGRDIEYRDAIYYSLEEYASLDKDKHEKEKKRRLNEWRQTLENPPVEEKISKEKVLDLIKMIDEQKEMLEAQKSELNLILKG